MRYYITTALKLDPETKAQLWSISDPHGIFRYWLNEPYVYICYVKHKGKILACSMCQMRRTRDMPWIGAITRKGFRRRGLASKCVNRLSKFLRARYGRMYVFYSRYPEFFEPAINNELRSVLS